MSIELSAEQSRAADAVAAWLKSRDKPYFYLAGYAGCGKTSTAKALAELQNGKVKFAAFSGKAARVLNQKGCPATTIHSLIYMPQGEINEEIAELEKALLSDPPPDAAKEARIVRRLGQLREPRFSLRASSQLTGISLLVLDEVSMLNEEIARDLLSFNVPILVLGDPGQLPPVKGEGFFTRHEPDFMLTEIHRQARDNPILQLATKARLGETLRLGDYGESRVISKSRFSASDALDVSQIICGMNKSRRALIAEVRKLRGFSSPFPQKDERLICLHNNPKSAVLNGQMFVATSDFDQDDSSIELRDEDDALPYMLHIHPECFTRPELVQSWAFKKRSQRNQFDWGWAITAHKSQGSEWDSVAVYADLFRWADAKDDFAKWLYTALTRARNRVIVAL